MITGRRWSPKRSLVTRLSIAVLLGVTFAVSHVCASTSVTKSSNSSDYNLVYNHSEVPRQIHDASKENEENSLRDFGPNLPSRKSSALGAGSRIQKRNSLDSSSSDDRSGGPQPENREIHRDNEPNPHAEQLHPKETVSSVHLQVLPPEDNEIAQNVPFASDENKEVVTSNSAPRYIRQPHSLPFSSDPNAGTHSLWAEDYSISSTHTSFSTNNPHLWSSSDFGPAQWSLQVTTEDDPYHLHSFKTPLQDSTEEGDQSQFYLHKTTWGFASPVCNQEDCFLRNPFEESSRTVSYPYMDYDSKSYKDFDFTRISASLQTKVTHKDSLDYKHKQETDSIHSEPSSFIPQRTLGIYSSLILHPSTLQNNPDAEVSSIYAEVHGESYVNTIDGSSTSNNTFPSLVYHTAMKIEGNAETSHSRDLNESMWSTKELSDRIKPTKVITNEIFRSSVNYTHYDSSSLEGLLPHFVDNRDVATQSSSTTSTGSASTVVFFGEMYPMRDKEDTFRSDGLDSSSSENFEERTNILASFYTDNDVFPTRLSTDILGIVYEEDTPAYWWPADVMGNNTQPMAEVQTTSVFTPTSFSLMAIASSKRLPPDFEDFIDSLKSKSLDNLKSSISTVVVTFSTSLLLDSGLKSTGTTLIDRSQAFTETWSTGFPSSTTVAFGAVPHITKDPFPNTPESGTDYSKEAQPNCNTVSVCILVTLSMTWAEFCNKTEEFKKYLSDFLSQYAKPILPRQIVITNFYECQENGDNEVLLRRRRHQSIVIRFFVTNKEGVYDSRMTEICGYILKKGEPVKGTMFSNKVTDVQLYHKDYEATVTENSSSSSPTNTGIIAAVTISAIAGACLLLLCIMLVLMKQRLAQARHCNPSMDAYSLDSFSVSASFRRRRARQSMRSFINHGFDDPDLPSRPLNFAGLANRIANKESLEEEFKSIPMNMPRIDQVPAGAEAKNRYANVIPIPESRVILASRDREANSDYINGNYVKGYGGKAQTYIACQAPLPETIEDFWRMVWEQQSKIIIMITQLDENNVSRCAPYFPESTLDCHMLFGDYQVSLQKKDMKEHYIMSTFRLYELEKNLFREVIHFWYTAWPPQGVPQDSGNLINFLLYVRPYINSNSGPAIVHCSPGTGRTGVLIALDICMREYEESQSVDLLRCIVRLRAERGGAVQTKEQYIFIHEAMHEYASRQANQSHRPSVKSNP